MFDEELIEASTDLLDINKRKRWESKSSKAMRVAFVENRKRLVEVLDKMSEKKIGGIMRSWKLKIRNSKQVGRALMLLLEHFS